MDPLGRSGCVGFERLDGPLSVPKPRRSFGARPALAGLGARAWCRVAAGLGRQGRWEPTLREPRPWLRSSAGCAPHSTHSRLASALPPRGCSARCATVRLGEGAHSRPRSATDLPACRTGHRVQRGAPPALSRSTDRVAFLRNKESSTADAMTHLFVKTGWKGAQAPRCLE